MKLSDRLNCPDLEALKLKQTTLRRPTDNEPISRTLYQIYNSKNPTGKPHVANQFLASIIDACCTQLLTEFLLSNRILGDLIKNNPNIDRKTCSGLEYKLFMKEMISGGVLEVIEKPSVYGKEHGKAGKYKILYSEVVQYIETRKEIYKQKAKQEADEQLLLAQAELLKIQEAEKAEAEVVLDKLDHPEECECRDCINYEIFATVRKPVRIVDFIEENADKNNS
jgi:hypothetical protein